MISSLLTLFLIGVAALVVLSVVGALLGAAVGLFFKLIPVLIIGYIVVRLLAPRPKKLSAEDREWLES